MKLSKLEKKEMLSDGLDARRRFAFRKGEGNSNPISFEEYIAWLEEMQSIMPRIQKSKSVHYKNVRI